MKRFCLVMAVVVVMALMPVMAVDGQSEGSASETEVQAAYGRLPLHFEANQGQVDAQVDFLSRSAGHTLFLTPREAVLMLRAAAATSERGPGQVSMATVRIQLTGANPHPRAVGLDELLGKVNYFIGNDPTKWRTDIPTYAKILYQDVYPGIDLYYYGAQGGLEYDFVVRPGAEPEAITLGLQGADRIEVDAQGDLVLHTAVGRIRQRKPAIYQEGDGVRREIAGGYVMLEPYRVSLQVAAYDRSRPLVIDPVLLYSAYLGGGSGLAIAVDTAGNAYVTGATQSSDFPTTPGAFQTTYRGGWGSDALVTKLNPSGSGLVYSTYLGGTDQDGGYGIAVDSAGNAYVAGYAESGDFPTTPGAFRAVGDHSAFVAKLNPTGSGLVYSTYLGGGGSFNQPHISIAVDAAGNAYMTGLARWNFPTTPGAFQTANGDSCDAFVMKLNPNGSGLVYSTYVGGSRGDQGDYCNEMGRGIGVDGAGNAYVTGMTSSTDFPTTPGVFQTTPAGGFVTKLNPTGSELIYSTYLNGLGYGIAVDAAGNAYVIGSAESGFSTTPGAFQRVYGGGASGDAFVTKLNPSGSDLVYSTYLGGSDSDWGRSIVVDATGSAYVTGSTQSTNFPTTAGAIQPTSGGSFDVFVTRLNPNGSGLAYSTYLGGGNNDDGWGIAVDAARSAYVTGVTTSTSFPATAMFGTAPAGAFVAKISGTAAVPGWFQAEDFDDGGEGVAYHDRTPGNQVNFYRLDVDVDIRQQPDGGVIVFNFETGEWLEYTINVTQADTYRLELLVSNENWSPSPRWHAEVDGAPVTGSVTVPNTGSWNTFSWAGVGGISLTAGTHVPRIVADQQYFGFAALWLLTE